MKTCVVLAAMVAALFIGAGTAQADNEQGYIDTLIYQFGWVIWDYPAIVSQGHIVCDLLYDDINPVGWLRSGPAYDAFSAAQIVVAAKMSMCPNAAVTSYE